jgi:hypothetical protein
MFCNQRDNKCIFNYLLAVSGHLNVVSEVQNALNAVGMKCLKKALSAVTKCWLPPVTTNLYKLWNGEYPTGQCIENLTLTDILRIVFCTVLRMHSG